MALQGNPGESWYENMLSWLGADVSGAYPSLEQRLSNITGGSGSRLPQTVALGAYVVLTNVGANYDTVAVSRGLGIALVDFTGAASVAFRVRCNKVGTGTQSWQLWNETDGAEIVHIDDAAAAGDNKLLSGSSNVSLTGQKVVRVRCKSTVAGDDPVYYGASILLA